MKTRTQWMGLMAVFFLAAVWGCGQQAKTSNSQEAIAQADRLSTAEEKIRFLQKEAEGFLKQEKYTEAIETAQYILTRLEKNSQEAQAILAQAKDQLKAQASEARKEVEGKVKNVMGSLGQ